MKKRGFLIRLALRNMWRHKKRTLVTASVISLALMIYISMDAHLASMNSISYRNIIDFESGHIQAVDPDYWEDKEELPLEHIFTLTDELEKIISSYDEVASYADQLDFQARMNDGIDELPVIGRGVDPDSFLEVFSLSDHILEGEFIKSGEDRVVMGKALADLMDLEIGDFVILLLRTREDYFDTIEAEIAGLIHTPNPKINEYLVYYPLDRTQEILNAPEMATHLTIRLKESSNTEAAAAALKASLSGGSYNLKIIPWYDQEGVSVMSAKNMGNQMILSIILLIAALGIINSVILSALERMHETGMMKALGMERKEIISVFVFESAGIALLGSIIGCLLGAAGVALLAEYGVDYSAAFGDMSQYGVPVLGPIYADWNPKAFVTVFIFATTVAIFSSVFPAWWAASKDPVDALYGR